MTHALCISASCIVLIAKEQFWWGSGKRVVAFSGVMDISTCSCIHLYGHFYNSGCKNGVGDGNSPKVQRLIEKWIGTRERLFWRKGGKSAPPCAMLETQELSQGISYPYNHV